MRQGAIFIQNEPEEITAQKIFMWFSLMVVFMVFIVWYVLNNACGYDSSMSNSDYERFIK
jgi:hypothetical protein